MANLMTSQNLYENLLHPVATHILPKLEMDGIFVIHENLQPAKKECQGRADEVKAEILEQIPESFVPNVKNKKARDAGFNPGSPGQLADLLFNYLKLKPYKFTGKGLPSTNESTLKELESQHPIIHPILEYRKWTRFQNFLDRWGTPIMDGGDLDPEGFIHPHYNLKPVTGRLSCVPLDTQALTRKGWRKWDQLVIGEEILSYDIIHDCYTWSRLKNIYRGRGSLGGLKIGKRRREEELLLCTPEHKWIVTQKRDQKHRPDFRGVITAQHIALGRNLSLVTQITTPVPEGKSTVSPIEAAIIGWAITDGHRRRTGVDRYSLSIRVTKSTSIKALETLMENIPHSRHTYRGAEDFSIGVEVFQPIWDKFDGREEEYILELSQISRESMFEAMMEADGNRTTGHNRFSKGKGSLGDRAMELLALLLGKPYTSRFYDTGKSYPMKEYHFLTECRYDLNTSYKVLPNSEDEVWCPETELGTWVMRQGRHVAITGNSEDPNLQQAPKDSMIRKCLGAPPGFLIQRVDYSQIELRIAAHYSQDPRMVQAYQNGEDLHWVTALNMVSGGSSVPSQEGLSETLRTASLYCLRHSLPANGISLKILSAVWRAFGQGDQAESWLQRCCKEWKDQEPRCGEWRNSTSRQEPLMERGVSCLAKTLQEEQLRALRDYQTYLSASQGQGQQELGPDEFGDALSLLSLIGASIAQEFSKYWPKMRKNAKPVGFGFLYGMFPEKFVQYAKDTYGVRFTLAEAEKYRDAYFTAYAGLPAWHQAQIDFVHEHCYVQSFIGRVRHLHDIKSTDWLKVKEAERQAINSPVQSLGSDFVLMSTIEIDKELPQGRTVSYYKRGAVKPVRECRLAGLVHDETLYLIEEDKVEKWNKRIVDIMQNPPLHRYTTEKFTVPIIASPEKPAQTWGG
jgi:DNA polymerase I-like protein with 3'-5' exonuclease and polymerase domains